MVCGVGDRGSSWQSCMSGRAHLHARNVISTRGRCEHPSLGLRADVAHFMATVVEAEAPSMSIAVGTLTGQQLQFHLPPRASAKWLTQAIHDEQGVPTDQQRLIFAGTQLRTDVHIPLADCGVTDGAMIMMVLRLRGGVWCCSLTYAAVLCPAPNSINVSTRAEICIEIDASNCRHQLTTHLDQYLSSSQYASWPGFRDVSEGYDQALDHYLDTLVGQLEFSVVRVRQTLVRRTWSGGTVARRLACCWLCGDSRRSGSSLRRFSACCSVTSACPRWITSRGRLYLSSPQYAFTPCTYHNAVQTPSR